MSAVVDTARFDVPTIDIVPTRGWRGVDVQALWAYRELLYVLVWRDLKVRYRQTVLGVLWVMGQPVLSMIIFTLVFNRIARIDAGGLPYSLFVLAGLLPWSFFANGVQNASNSLIGNVSLITKVYFPRLLIPAASVLAGLVDFAVAAIVLAALFLWNDFLPQASLVFVPVVVVIAVAIVLGLGLLLAAINVKYRDVRVMIPFVLQIWMYATPVVYPLHLLPETLRNWAVLNPMVGVVEGMRWCLFGGTFPGLPLAISAGFGVALLALGTLMFRRMERTFVDVI